MSDVAIRVEGLGKEYHLGAQKQRYHTLGDQIRKITSIRNLLRRGKRAESRPPFWALKDVSFEVKKGEAVGIIGRNGAGKSTLLKILSRITEPTTGEVDIHGRVGSLLEVGTGFHPELTGRENIYLNGAILGMRRSEIVRKFDEIVAFAEVDKFVDTPVKHYSSGMYTRLAFSVAAHLEPEILIVDEVLAVGDAQFQKKCMGKMGEVAGSGRTVLFVSHNMAMINRLCSRAVLLSSGAVAAVGTTSEVVTQYLTEYKAGTRLVRTIQSGQVFTLVGGEITRDDERPAIIRFDLEIQASNSGWTSLDLRLCDGTGTPVGFGSLGVFSENDRVQLNPGINRVSFELDAGMLANGEYMASIDLTVPEAIFFDRAENCFAFEVVRPPTSGRDRVLPQSWGYGGSELRIARVS